LTTLDPRVADLPQKVAGAVQELFGLVSAVASELGLGVVAYLDCLEVFFAQSAPVVCPFVPCLYLC
jgi:hypothetical protein